jgi:hypothetical protein
MASPDAVLFAWTELLPESIRGYLEGPLGVLLLVVVGTVVIYLLAWMSGKAWVGIFGRPVVDLEKGQREKLADYPPSPGDPGPRRLTVQGLPVRVRLVVVAPIGKASIVAEEVEALLEQIIRGLGDIAGKDKPRVRVWPAQLSNTGFAPVFHRLTEKPEPDGQPSRWVLVAGQARAGGKPVLLGLALWADEASTLGRLTLDQSRWGEVLRVQTLES